MEDSWEHVADVGERGFDLSDVVRFETLNTFQFGDGTYVFGLHASRPRNRASIWKVNEETWSFKRVGQGPFPSDTVLVLSFQADNHPYLFSLDKERNTGNIWRIRDGLEGWDRVYWADHRVQRSREQLGVDLGVYAGYFRRFCTTFRLNGRPYMFMKWWEDNLGIVSHTAYIVGLERRNWIRLVNKGAFDAKFYVQYKEGGEVVTWESGQQNTLYEKVVHLPADTRTVLLNAQAWTLLTWNRIIREDVAVNCTYTVGGALGGEWCRVEDATGKKASY